MRANPCRFDRACGGAVDGGSNPSEQAQANSLEVPSSSGATAPASETATTGETGENGKAEKHHKAAHSEPKKKKTSFVHKMRDKAMEKVQNLFGSKLEPKPEPKPETNVE